MKTMISIVCEYNVISAHKPTNTGDWIPNCTAVLVSQCTMNQYNKKINVMPGGILMYRCKILQPLVGKSSTSIQKVIIYLVCSELGNSGKQHNCSPNSIKLWCRVNETCISHLHTSICLWLMYEHFLRLSFIS